MVAHWEQFLGNVQSRHGIIVVRNVHVLVVFEYPVKVSHAAPCQQTDFFDQPGKASGGKCTPGEAQEDELVSINIVLYDKSIGLSDMFIETIACGAAEINIEEIVA